MLISSELILERMRRSLARALENPRLLESVAQKYDS